MQIISTRTFRSNQSRFLDLANKGEDVVLKSRSHGSFMVVPLTHDDTIEISPALRNELEKARKEFERGEAITFHNASEAQKWMDSL